MGYSIRPVEQPSTLITSMAAGNSEKAGLQVFDNEETKAGSSTLTVGMSRDEYTLATLGYRQVFVRSFGLFENVRVTSSCEDGEFAYEWAVGCDFYDDEFRIGHACAVRICNVC